MGRRVSGAVVAAVWPRFRAGEITVDQLAAELALWAEVEAVMDDALTRRPAP